VILGIRGIFLSRAEELLFGCGCVAHFNCHSFFE